MANQTFLDNLNGLPALWLQITSIFAKKTDVPTKTSQLTNDSGYLTTHVDVSGKLDKTGDASNVTNTFTQAGTRANLVSKETLAVSLGKIMKYFTDLKAVAFSGSYADLSNKPTIPTTVAALSDSADYAKKSEIPTDNVDLGNGAGYQTATQVNSAITAKGYQTAAQVESAITSKGYQTSSQVDSKISSALSSVIEWKGNVATATNLPASPNKGHMYNITASSPYGPAGTNVVWNGTEWDPMAGTFSVTAMTADEVIAICQ
ncbi:hypothetical protein [Lacrimispora sp.]|uniref:hypothetical protein n=1 Tax=Lacrimispora sp. TaxID=2719234 RepID=UPI003460FECA